MEKQFLTMDDIACDLGERLRKKRPAALWLTAFLSVALFAFFYSIASINSVKTDGNPVVAVLIFLTFFLLLGAFLLDWFYIDLYNIKNRKFSIKKEKLLQKRIENVRYYRHTEKENLLYFHSGRIAVDAKVYNSSALGDWFYIIRTRHRRGLLVAYPVVA